MTSGTFQQDGLSQQGYHHSSAELKNLSNGLRFTPALCMAFALLGLYLGNPQIHFALAALGILPFWLPAHHPFDLLYNHVLRHLFGGVKLPPNPLPRRIACVMGGLMNIGIGLSFLAGQPILAYVFGAVLIALQLVVISSHFCVASWMHEGVLKMLGQWSDPVSLGFAQKSLSQGGVFVDVREPQEFREGHIKDALNVPLGRLAEEKDNLKNKKVLLYCQSGNRSKEGHKALRNAGLKNVHNFGAMARWE